MIVHFERSGGFTAIPLTLQMDTQDLDHQESLLIHAQIAAADFFNLPSKIEKSGRGYDRFTFCLEVRDEARSHRVEVGDSNVPQPLQPLIDQLTQMARNQRKPD